MNRRYSRGAWIARAVGREFGLVTLADALMFGGIFVLLAWMLAMVVLP